MCCRPRLPSHVFSSLRTLIERCWDKDPAERPAFKTVVDLLESEVLNEVRPRSMNMVYCLWWWEAELVHSHYDDFR